MKLIFTSIIGMIILTSCKIASSPNSSVSGNHKICNMLLRPSILTINFNLINTSEKVYTLFVNNIKIDENCGKTQDFCLAELTNDIQNNAVTFFLTSNTQLEKIDLTLEAKDSTQNITQFKRTNEILNWDKKYYEDNCQTTFYAQLDINE